MQYSELISLLSSLKPGVDFEKEERLIERRILSSFDIVSLVGELNDSFDVEIEAVDIVPENFFSARSILALIERRSLS